jgi:predicted acylesterase/phospholipase RssA
LGAIYEIGALCALEESLQGLSLTKLHHYVGVSAGGFIAAGLANQMTPRELCAAFIENDHQASEVFDPAWLLVPAYGEFFRRGIMLPGLTVSALWRYLGETEDDRIDLSGVAANTLAAPKIDSTNYFDLSGSWRFTENARVNFGVRNLFEEDAPLVGDVAEQSNTFPETYDVFGRRYFVSASYKF